MRVSEHVGGVGANPRQASDSFVWSRDGAGRGPIAGRREATQLASFTELDLRAELRTGYGRKLCMRGGLCD